MPDGPLRIGVVMDPIGDIHPHKDSTLAMLLEADRRGHPISYLEMGDLSLRDGVAVGAARELTVRDDDDDHYSLADGSVIRLDELDVILMRKDPPFDMEYIYATYLLERAASGGALVVNAPKAIRDVSEKVFTAWFPELCPPTLIDRDIGRFRAFVREQGRAVIKPLDGMGGASIFVTHGEDTNLSVILETLTGSGTRFAMAQAYQPRISEGDKRILLVDGEPVPELLARIPAAGESRGNLAAGGRGEVRPLEPEDRRIAEAVGPTLRDMGLMFVGLDVIGDKLTEINVTSPTCIREIDAATGGNIAGQLFDAIERRLG